ncbi:prolactin-releasing peptide receptor-like [Ornithodoros turicata]|uniref:prolactin-releasing peptide receptor-like n=1 Tax=Ornithodoros turicata TaxID=34597 RepID=UPI0031395628
MQALGNEFQAFLIALYSVTALLALAGNLMVIVVLVLGKRSSNELRLFLVNLALSDVAMAVFSIPFTYTDFMLGRWIFDPLFCPVVLFMQHLAVIVSVYTLTAIGVDRYYAIMHPLSFRWTRKRGPHIILGIWVVGALLSSVQFVHGRATEFVWAGRTYYDCNENWEENSGKVYTAVVFTVTFMTPMVVLTFTYTSIGWKMWRHTSPGNADVHRDQQQLSAKMKVVKMLATVVLMFALCWLPIHLMNLILYFDRESIEPTTDAGTYLYFATFFGCHWFSMANSFVNPIIYCFMSDNFREDLRQLTSTCCPSLRARSVGRRCTKRSSYGGSTRSTTLVVSGTSRCNGFSVSPTSVVPLRALNRSPRASATFVTSIGDD